MKAIRPAFSNFIKKGAGSGGGSKPDVSLHDKPIAVTKVNSSLEAQNRNVLSQLDQISRQNMNAR